MKYLHVILWCLIGLLLASVIVLGILDPPPNPKPKPCVHHNVIPPVTRRLGNQPVKDNPNFEVREKRGDLVHSVRGSCDAEGNFTGVRQITQCTHHCGQRELVERFENGSREGIATFTIGGSLGTKTPYKNGLINGEMQKFSGPKLHLTSEYQDNLKHGVERSWDRGYSKKHFEKGRLNGLSVSQTLEGRMVSIETYEDDLLHGKAWMWHPEGGGLAAMVTFYHGTLDGVAWYWDEQGHLVERREYCRDEPSGVWLAYDKDGKSTPMEGYRTIDPLTDRKVADEQWRLKEQYRREDFSRGLPVGLVDLKCAKFWAQPFKEQFQWSCF